MICFGRAMPPVGGPIGVEAPCAGTILRFMEQRAGPAGQGRRPAPIKGLTPPLRRAAAMPDLRGVPQDGGPIGAQARHEVTFRRIMEPRAAPVEKRRRSAPEEGFAPPLIRVAAMPDLTGCRK